MKRALFLVVLAIAGCVSAQPAFASSLTVKSRVATVKKPAAVSAADIDLSYVNKTGQEYATYKAWVDANLNRTDGYLFLATDAAYMAKLDGGPQYCAKAVAMVDTYVAKVEAAVAAGGQPNWGADSNGSDGISSDSYLNVGGHVRDIALVLKWCQPTAAQVTRFSAVAQQAVFNVWNPSAATWGGRAYPWTGWGTNDPANNYYYSFTLATQMWAWAGTDQQWSTRLTAQTWPLLAGYMATIPSGGSEEGTGYGTSHKGLFEITRFQRQLFGTDYTDAHLMSSIRYWVHTTTPDLKHFAAIGDQSRYSEPTLTDYQRAIVLQAMSNTQDAAAKSLGSWWLHAITPAAMTSNFDYRDGLLNAGSGGSPPIELVYNGSSTGDLFVRTGWDTGAMWAAFRAGKYDQSHAHQDQGAFQLFQGIELASDENIWTHSGIVQGVINNNTLRFVKNGATLRQVYGSTSTMTVSGTSPTTGVHAQANLAAAAGASAVSGWIRSFDMVDHTVTITDAYTAAPGVTAVFQVNTRAKPIVSGKTATAGALTITVLEPADAVLSVVDWHAVGTSVEGGPGDYLSGYKLEVTSASNTGFKIAMSTGGTTPPPVCTNDQHPVTPTCSDGSTQPGTWSRSNPPACVWTFAAGICPVIPPQPDIRCPHWKFSGSPPPGGKATPNATRTVVCQAPYTIQSK